MDYPKITLAAARVNAGYSQKEAAKKLNISNKTFRISKMLLSIDIITNDSDGLICLSSIKHIDSKKELFKIVDFISRLNKIDRFNWYLLMKDWANSSLENYIMSFCEQDD